MNTDERICRIVLTKMLPQVGFFPTNRDGTVDFKLDYKAWNELYLASKEMQEHMEKQKAFVIQPPSSGPEPINPKPHLTIGKE